MLSFNLCVKLLLFQLLLSTGSTHSNAQQRYNKNDSARVWAYLAKAEEWIDRSKYDSAVYYGNNALLESSRLKFIRGEAYAHLKIAEIFYRKSQFQVLGLHDSAALKSGLLLKDTMLIALSYFQLGQYFAELKKYAEAEQLFLKSLALKFEKEQGDYAAYVYNDMGSLYGFTGAIEKQVDWYLKAVRLHQKNKNEYGLAQTYSNLNDSYYELNQFYEAINYGKLSFALREKLKDYPGLAISCNNLSQTYLRVDSVQQAVYYQELGLKYAEQSGLPSRMAHSYVSMSLLMNRQKKFEEALNYEKKAIAIYETVDRNVQANRYIAAAFYSNILKDSAGAVAYFKQSEALAKELNNKVVLRNVYFYLSEFYRVRKDAFLAYDYYRKHILYRDSLTSIETNTKIAALQTQFETEKKDFEINRLNTLQRIKQLEIEKQKAIIAGNQLEALQKQNEIDLLSKSKELQGQQLQRQADELERQQLLTKNNEQRLQLAEKEKQLQSRQISNEKTFRNFLIGGLVLLLLLGYLFFNRYQLNKKLEQQNSLLAMRNNISENLHDDIGASLSNIGILTELAKRNIHNEQKSTEYLDKAGEDIQRISESISDIVWNINPKYDELKNLFIRMKRYAADMLDGKNISYELNFSDEAEVLSLSMEKRRNFYLIFKEAVNNLVKYSQAKKAVIEVSSSHQRLQLSIKDDGKGFDTSAKSTGNGLHNMQKRAQEMKGNFRIQSTKGKGTEILLEIPIT
ncbi:MAG: tetratricopeptide repeat protein [Chitinophagaceae bacterium]|nr:tetratricopeptide repeat protein [Chitinophagaceae bacterium]